MNPRVSRIRPILRPEQRRREREEKTRRRARDAIHRLRLEPRRARRAASSDPCANDANTKSRAHRQSKGAHASSPSPRVPLLLGSTVDRQPFHASLPTTLSRARRAHAHVNLANVFAPSSLAHHAAIVAAAKSAAYAARAGGALFGIAAHAQLPTQLPRHDITGAARHVINDAILFVLDSTTTTTTRRREAVSVVNHALDGYAQQIHTR